DLRVDLARGHVGGRGEVLVHEALVVAQIQVRLRAIVGDEDLAVLVRAHGARVDVEVGVQLLEVDGEAPTPQDAADRGSRDPFAERRDYTAGHENVVRQPGPPAVFVIVPFPGRLGPAEPSPARPSRDQCLPRTTVGRSLDARVEYDDLGLPLG